MGFFGRLFGGDEEKNTGEEARRKTVSGFQALELQSATGRSLASINPYDEVLFTENREEATASISVRREGSVEPVSVVTCHLPKDSNDRTEMIRMMRTLNEDIGVARRNHTKVLRVPTNEYDLYAYMRRRPATTMDFDGIESALKEHKKVQAMDDLGTAIKSKQRVDFFIAMDSLYNVEAYKILKDEWKNYRNVIFHEIERGNNTHVFWRNLEILKIIKDTPETIPVGLGIVGSKPPHSLSLVSDQEGSVIEKVSVLIGRPMNTRQLLLDAQFRGHFNLLYKTGKERGMSLDVIRSSAWDLAAEEARYRLSEKQVKDFTSIVQTAIEMNPHAFALKAPFNDEILIRNMFPEAETGLAVDIGDQTVYYYGDEESISLLVEGVNDIHWTQDGPGMCHIDVPAGKKIELYNKMAKDVCLRSKYIRDMQETLLNNEEVSIKDAYNNIVDLVVRYNATGFTLDDQIQLLQPVAILRENPSYQESIVNIMTEALTDENPYLSFGVNDEETAPQEIPEDS